MKRLLFAVLIVVVVAGVAAAPASAAARQQTVSYVVRPDDTLSSIARQFCTTWQHVYHINRAVIGPNPNVLRSGTVLQVPNQCGGGATPTPPPSGGCNLGPIPHAMGPLNGNVYTVVAGDTLFSIARRFCTTVNQLAAANGIRHPSLIFAGQRLTAPVGPGPSPSPTPPAPSATIAITSPTANMLLPRGFNVVGTASGVQPGAVVVQALSRDGTILYAETSVAVPGGSGSWLVTLTVNVPAVTDGQIVAFWTQNSGVRSSVPVRFSGT